MSVWEHWSKFDKKNDQKQKKSFFFNARGCYAGEGARFFLKKKFQVERKLAEKRTQGGKPLLTLHIPLQIKVITRSQGVAY